MKARWTLTAWAKQKEVQEAWRELAMRHDLTVKEIPDPERVLAFTDGALLGGAQVTYSMDKAKKMGWHGKSYAFMTRTKLPWALWRPSPQGSFGCENTDVGCTGFVDSDESIMGVLKDFVQLKMLPPLPDPTYYM